MKNLTEIGLKFGTDKAEYHEFTEFYDEFFAKVAKAQESPRILEVGILDGGSLKMYDEFFRGKAKIVGIDMVDKSYLFPHSDNVLCLRGDVLSQDAIEKCRKAGGLGYDIIIDDGGHTMEQQQKTLKNLWPMLKPGGYFIIEDLHTSGIEDYNPDRTTTTLAILEALGEGRYEPSIYLSVDELKALDEEMEVCVVAKQDFPQVRTQQPRTSITSLIQKKLTTVASSSSGTVAASEELPVAPPATEPVKSFTDIVNQLDQQIKNHPQRAGALTSPVVEKAPEPAPLGEPRTEQRIGEELKKITLGGGDGLLPAPPETETKSAEQVTGKVGDDAEPSKANPECSEEELNARYSVPGAANKGTPAVGLTSVAPVEIEALPEVHIVPETQNPKPETAPVEPETSNTKPETTQAPTEQATAHVEPETPNPEPETHPAKPVREVVHTSIDELEEQRNGNGRTYPAKKDKHAKAKGKKG